MATGLAIMGFGGGALIAAPLSNKLLDAYVATPADAIAPAFLTLGAIYFVVIGDRVDDQRAGDARDRPRRQQPPVDGAHRRRAASR